MGYLEEIKKEWIHKVAKKQISDVEDEYKQYLLGEYCEDPDEFFSSVYRTFLDEDKRRSFLVNNDFSKQFKCEHVDKILEKQRRFRFFTPSIFWHHKDRTKEELIWITQITLDFDLMKDGSNREFNPQDLAYILDREFGYLPNVVWSSRTNGNYQASYLIKPMTGTARSIYYYESVVKRMAILIGADVAATSAVNLYSIPKSGFWKFSEEIHSIEDFDWVLEEEDIEKSLEKKRSEKVVSFTEKQIMKHESIQALLNAEFVQWRNNAAFTIALLYYALGKSKKEAYDFLNGPWFDLVNDGRFPSRRGKFRRKEVKTTVESAYSGRYHGPSREWIYLITGIEFPYNLYKSSYIKKEDGYQSANEIQLKILKWLESNSGKWVKRKAICASLNIPEKSFRRNLDELHGRKLDYESKTGANGGYFIRDLRSNKDFGVEVDTSVSLDGIIDYSNIKRA
ncbi:hypothetical protein [Halobacillus faecis]|uniref:Replication protein RepR n=1 Tax=Halobacillus faecis TaxID=360184 RepID=A0A511WWK8_9BACI|nr:hypothetical protein [Halobacillus faecis]GEN55516.1 replication protein RepR [Halobacillus faecis]